LTSGYVERASRFGRNDKLHQIDVWCKNGKSRSRPGRDIFSASPFLIKSLFSGGFGEFAKAAKQRDRKVFSRRSLGLLRCLGFAKAALKQPKRAGSGQPAFVRFKSTL
jgi:hypothetical protein